MINLTSTMPILLGWKIKHVDLSRVDNHQPLELRLLTAPAFLIGCSHRITEMISHKVLFALKKLSKTQKSLVPCSRSESKLIKLGLELKTSKTQNQ